jgi:hypothetical protein
MTLPACVSFAFVFIPFVDISPVPGMGIHLAAPVAPDAHIRIRMARFAGLQIPPRFRPMIRIPGVALGGAGRPVRFDLHAPFLPYFAVAVGAETRLVAPITGLRIVRRLDGMDRDKIGPVRSGQEFSLPRGTPTQIRFDASAGMTIQAE